jgi:hypothetical protein
MLRAKVAVNVPFGMQHFKSLNQLLCQFQGKFELKFSFFLYQQLIQRRPKKIHHHVVIVSLSAVLVDMGKAKVCGEILSLDALHDPYFIEKFGLADRPLFEFDGDFCLVLVVLSLEHLVEGTNGQLIG